jgi:hypothetical protein
MKVPPVKRNGMGIIFRVQIITAACVGGLLLTSFSGSLHTVADLLQRNGSETRSEPVVLTTRIAPLTPVQRDVPVPIDYRLLKKARVTLHILNEQREVVRRLDMGIQTPGKYRVLWNGNDETGARVILQSFIVELTIEPRYR